MNISHFLIMRMVDILYMDRLVCRGNIVICLLSCYAGEEGITILAGYAVFALFMVIGCIMYLFN